MDIYKLNWGNTTPEGYDKINREVLHVFNFDITNRQNIERSITFGVGKVYFTSRNIPDGLRQKIVLDFRGQPITLLTRARTIKTEIISRINKISESVVLSIEILI